MPQCSALPWLQDGKMDTQEFRDAMTSLGDELSAHVRYLLQVISFLHCRLWCLSA